MAIKTAIELAAAVEAVAKKHKTLYVSGCIGAPMTEANKVKYTTSPLWPYNKKSGPKKAIMAADAETFGFDCICLIKALLWGWGGNKYSNYGGAKYESNGVPDINADAMITVCEDVSTDFSKLEVGEYLWLKGHCGIYIGNGLAVECTPKWDNCVQITAVTNIGKKPGYNSRKWTKHGKLPYITYSAEVAPAIKTIAVALPVLRKGHSGAAVEALQALLKLRGYPCGSYGPNKDGVDGSFGNGTGDALEKFQSANNLTVDRAAGPQVWAAIIGTIE